MRCLVVDDFLTMRRVLRRLLEELGVAAVDEAADGAAALALLRSESVDVVISDIDMPIMDGFQLLAAIRKDEALKHLPVLMVAAEARKDDIVRAVQGGAAGCLVKPFTRAALEQRLRHIAPGEFAAAAEETR